jgi:four helix bundle protein
VLPRGMVADVLGRQLVRSATSVAANYRSACRAKSRSDFISKMGTVEEEADETMLWLELIADAGLLPGSRLAPLTEEANALTAIAVKSIRTARAHYSRLVADARQPQSAAPNPQ